MWLEDLNELLEGKELDESAYPHGGLKDNLREYCDIHGFPKPYPLITVSAWVMQDQEGGLTLITENHGKDTINASIRREGPWQPEDLMEDNLMMERFIESYGLKRLVVTHNKLVAGFNLNNIPDHSKEVVKSETKTIVDIDILGRLREDIYFCTLARNYGMNWTQFLRLRALTRNPIYLQEWLGPENVAKMIMGLPYQGPRMMQEGRTGY